MKRGQSSGKKITYQRLNYNKWSINLKFKAMLILITVISTLAISLISYLTNKRALKDLSTAQLTAIRETKKRAIEDYFNQASNQIKTFSENGMIINAMKEFKEAYNNIPEFAMGKYGTEGIQQFTESTRNYYESHFLPQLNQNTDNEKSTGEFLPDNLTSSYLQFFYIANNPNETGYKHLLNSANDGSQYSETHRKYHPIIRSFLEKFNYYDIFLIDNETGNIVYTVFKEVDFSTNLLNGPYRNTNFADAFELSTVATGKDYVKLVDFEEYAPSNSDPASFISSPIYEGDKQIGVLAFQISTNKINSILTGDQNWVKEGLGKTGETYIVGNDLYMRSLSRSMVQNQEEYIKNLEKAGFTGKVIDRILRRKSPILSHSIDNEAVQDATMGHSGTKIIRDYRNKSILSAYAPLDIPGVQWVILSERDTSEIFAPIKKLRIIIFTTFIILLVIVILMGERFSNTISTNIILIRNTINTLSRGEVTKELQPQNEDELAQTMLALNVLSNRITEVSAFGRSMGNGNFDHIFTPVSDKDQLGISMNEMKNSLMTAAQEEKERKEEDRRRAWITQGTARFSELLRTHIDNIARLSETIVYELAAYLNLNQVSMFVIEKNYDGEDVLILKAAYAYDRKKYLKKEIYPGEGLAGAAVLEKKYKYLTNIPDDYISITSGLGKANPKTLFILPLLLENEVMGVIELASFDNLKDFEIEFLDGLAQSIASSINTVKINEQTSVLLLESEQRAQEIEQQEEEMRQKLMELRATREELDRLKRKEEERKNAGLS